ncbi:putative gustatory receptor 28b [Photinus pyralis]|uniref:putative gustatory receptor 28b n=1 Tax=Photinus pyralis TaxID=7054 RepID=UPI0012672A0F|nr:putative gustatory receptor 28b [Photinus pyralis]
MPSEPQVNLLIKPPANRSSKMDRCDFLRASSVIHAAQKYMGMNDYYLRRESGELKRYGACGPYKIYHYSLIAILCVAQLLAEFLLKPPTPRSVLQRVVFDYRAYSELVAVIGMAANKAMHANREIRCVEAICGFDEEMALIGFPVDTSEVRRFNFAYLSALFSMLALEFLGAFALKRNDPGFLMMHSVFLTKNVFKYMFAVSFRHWMLSVAYRFQAIGKSLTVVADRSSLKLYKIRSVAKLHVELCEILDTLQRSKLLTALLLLVVNWITVVIEFYHMAISLYQWDRFGLSMMPFTCYAILLHSIDSTFIVICCGQIRTKANLLKRPLLQLMTNERDEHIRKEINAFGLQLLHHDVKVTAGKFFTIDTPLIFAMVAAGCTYLVILVQFELAFA